MIRFPTSSLLAVTTIVALGVWCYIPLSPARFFIAAPLVGAVAGIVIKTHRPTKLAIVGLLFVVLPVAAHWTYLWIDYACIYDHNQPQPYFEDGTIAEGVFYPIIYCLIYGTLAAAMACATGLFVTWANPFAGARRAC